jgi:hypothetical protein
MILIYNSIFWYSISVRARIKLYISTDLWFNNCGHFKMFVDEEILAGTGIFKNDKWEKYIIFVENN